VLAMNGVPLPQSQNTGPCGGEMLPMSIDDLHRSVQRAGPRDRLRITLERGGKRVDVDARRSRLAGLYLDAFAGGPGAQPPVVCVQCEKTCPGAINNVGYWICISEPCGDITTVQCANPCMTS
jgi:hypothetical protein